MILCNSITIIINIYIIFRLIIFTIKLSNSKQSKKKDFYFDLYIFLIFKIIK